MRNLPKCRAELARKTSTEAFEARAGRKVKHENVAQMLHSASPKLW